jgi:hypothetical protein
MQGGLLCRPGETGRGVDSRAAGDRVCGSQPKGQAFRMWSQVYEMPESSAAGQTEPRFSPREESSISERWDRLTICPADSWQARLHLPNYFKEHLQRTLYNDVWNLQ